MKTKFYPWLLVVAVLRAGPVSWTSPDGHLCATLAEGAGGRPEWSLTAGGRMVAEPAVIGITVDGRDLGAGAKMGVVKKSAGRIHFPIIGGKAAADVAWTERAVELTAGDGGGTWTWEARLFDGGLAWRYRVQGMGRRVVGGEASAFRLPAGSEVWVAERANDWKLKSYAGAWMKEPVERLVDFSPTGPVQGPPLVAELKDGGYAVISEAALVNYSGMRLRAEVGRRLRVDFTERDGFPVAGEIVTPWRVVLFAEDLDALVNNSVIMALNRAPDQSFFADAADWLKPGRVAWRWWSEGTGMPQEERVSIDAAAQLKFEYSLVDDGWKSWPEAWRRVEELCAHGRERGVRVLLWCDYKDIADTTGDHTALRGFLDRAKAAGVAGVKLDFFNAESKDRIDFEERARRETAKRKMLVVFHGLQKPTGESRTWPNELTREGIRGLELNKMAEGPITAEHNCALPFTRFVVGPGDYTPLGFSRPGATTWAHQIATLVVFTSPLQVVAENPVTLLHDPRVAPVLDLIREMPTTWDETRVLRPSEIGRAAALARRKGGVWWVGMINAAPITVERLELSFLGRERYHAVVVRTGTGMPFARTELDGVGEETMLRFDFGEGDGALIRFTPER